MRSLKEWPGFWIAAAWLLWPALLIVAFAGFVLVELWPTLHTPQGVTYMPISIGNVHIRFEIRSALLIVAALVGPPALLTAGWIGWRRGSHGGPPA
jgi:hypothetical protein